MWSYKTGSRRGQVVARPVLTVLTQKSIHHDGQPSHSLVVDLRQFVETLMLPRINHNLALQCQAQEHRCLTDQFWLGEVYGVLYDV